MSGLRVALAGMLALGLVAGVRADDKKKAETTKEKLVGTWEAARADEGSLPVGSTVEFTKDGKVTITVTPPEGEKRMIEGTYTVEADKFTIATKMGDMERKQTITITKMTDTEMLIKGPEGKTVDFKKKKAK